MRAVCLLCAACCLAPLSPRAGEAPDPAFGVAASASDIAAHDTMVFPDGEGLPAAHGGARDGERLYVQYCLACHGLRGRGGSGGELAGAGESLASDTPDRTIGSYWPYATTLFDFIRRSMPMTAPGTLADGDVYALTAYLLALNGTVGDDAVLDAEALTRIEMPNRAGFIWVDVQAPGTP